MATATVPPTFTDTVWIGFMDIVPVIGTVKEAVELVLAVYEGDKAVIKEKEDAVKNSVKESFKKDVKKSTLPDKPAADADEFSGLGNVREVRMEMIMEHLKKGSKRGTKTLTPAQQKENEKEREKRVEDIKKDTSKKIRLIDPDYQELKERLREQLKKSKRGTHVFNNNILKFHSKVVKEFIKRHRIDELQGYDQHQQAVTELGRYILSQNTAKEIQKEMVVHFEPDEFYVNANAVLYGEYCRVLREAMLAVLNHINPDDVTEEETGWVNKLIDLMNNFQVYVDELARDKWIDLDRTGTRQIRFERVRREVACMYKRYRGFDWCIDILHEVAPLFGHRQ